MISALFKFYLFACLLSFFEQMYGYVLFLNSLNSQVNERGENKCSVNPVNERQRDSQVLKKDYQNWYVCIKKVGGGAPGKK